MPVFVPVSVPLPAAAPPPPVPLPVPVPAPVPVVSPLAAPAAAPAAVRVTIPLPPSLLHVAAAEARGFLLLRLDRAVGDLQHLGFPLQRAPHLHRLLQLREILPDLDEAQVQLPAEVICQSSVVVVDPKVGRANFTNSQFLN